MFVLRPSAFVLALFVLRPSAFVLAAEPAPALQTLTVQPGDTLWGLSQKYLKDPQRWPEILKYNELPTDDPTVALPGMSLRVPVVLIKESLRSAKVLRLGGEVVYRKKETPDWLDAAVGLDLFPADSVRTMRLAEAYLRFGTGETLDIRENSLVILAPPRLDAEAQLLKGQVAARRSRVTTAAAKVTPKTQDTEYTTRVLEDLRTLVQVYAGAASVEAQGKAVEVPAGFGSEVRLDQAPSMPNRLPALPEFAAKGPGRAGAGVADGKFTLELPEPGVTSAGEPGRPTVRESARYRGVHLQAARDPDFRELALDRVIGLRESFDLTQELGAGRYWWRIALVDLLGFESPFTAGQVLDLNLAAPRLEVLRPAEGERVAGPESPMTVEVEGTAEPGALVSVDGEPVAPDAQGRFSTRVKVKAGTGSVRVEARNRWGAARVSRGFLYEVARAEGATAEKPVEPEKSFEERVLKPYVIPAAAIVIFVAVGIGVILLFI